MQKTFEFTIKDLSVRYGIKKDHLNYLKYKKNYSDVKLKKTVFESKYGEGCHKTNYYNYFLPRIINRNNDFTELKKEFFTDFKLSQNLNRSIIENLWEDLMNYRFKLSKI